MDAGNRTDGRPNGHIERLRYGTVGRKTLGERAADAAADLYAELEHELRKQRFELALRKESPTA